jgi:predicted lipoprotein with Yx(FWY)xxD motif
MFGKITMSLLVSSLVLAACGGGGSGSGGGSLYGGVPNPLPSPSPQQGLPIKQNVAGSPAWVSPSNNHTLYYLDVDSPTGGTCTGGCLSVWPVFAPDANTTAQNGFTVAMRSDGTGKQVDFHSHPLYFYSGDGGPDQSNGNGIPLAGGHWHVARPSTN